MTSSKADQPATPADGPSDKPKTNRPVLPLLASVAISVSGDGAFIAAAPLLAASITTDPFQVAAVSAAFYLPWLVTGLFAGVLVDRWSRRRVMVSADLLRAVLLAGLTVLVATGNASIITLIITIFAVGVLQCFFDAASQAIIPALVGRDKDTLTRVNGRYWALDSAGRSLIGPPIGSLTFAASKALPFGLDAVSFVVSAFLVRLLPDKRSVNGSALPVLASIKEGMSFLVRTKDLRVLALAMGTFNFGFWLSMSTFVLYAKSILGLHDAAYGLLLAAMAAGGMIAAANAVRLTARFAYRQVQASAMVLQAVVWLGVAAATKNIFIIAVLFAIYGAGANLASVAVSSARQEHTPDELIGRVVSAFRLLGVGAAGLGALAGGIIADSISLRATFFVAAAVLIVAALPTWPRQRSQ